MDSREMFSNRCKSALGDGVMSSSSSSSISKNDYEVFLSFRGPDTRQGFTDCIYHALIDVGVIVFRDDDELAPGDKIDEILTALDNSKICIVVFSPTFAQSAWCLREVERMVDMKKDIVPIFYHVTTDDVKLKTELYPKDLIMHETKYGKEQVLRWMDALKEIPTIKGRSLKNNGFVEFSRQIAKEMLTKLKVKHKYEIKNLVQIPDEVEAALKLLDIRSGRRRFIGIHGMGGIGKTTLAKIIFNQISDSFDCSCFLENIRDYSSQGPDSLHKLQDRLLKSLVPSAKDIVDPINMIQTVFKRKKVVIVLDDVDQLSHLDSIVGDSSWFGNGSRIIFTTRNAQLHEQATSSDAQFYGLEKKEMDSKQALQLFSRHAFGEDSPPKDFEDLSIEAISTTGGLPLALEVVGSFLHRRKAKVWRDTIKKLKEAPHQDVQQKLKLSYDALEYEQQEIFLDIACFFIGIEKTYGFYMWEACEFYPNNGIDVLISMSLIKLNEKKCFWMHDQLRDLGRAIVKVNSKDARAGSRLWMHKDAVDLLKRNVGKEKVEALHLDGPFGYLDRENFVGLEKLRFLRLTTYATFCGDFDGLIPKLRWLSLKLDASSFNISNLCMRELILLEVSSCGFDETWPGWGQILISKQLKVLTLSDCHELITIPDVSKIVNLERLVLSNFYKLTSIHSSIGMLQRLRHLSITECKWLHELPESIGRLVSLTRLELEGVVNLPNSIGELVKLKHLSLKKCGNLRVLPDSIGDLRSLISLDLSDSGIAELPTTIGRLAKLKSLWLSASWGLHKIPDSIGNLHSLIDLDMSYSNVTELPHSFGNLASLRKFNLIGVRSFPDCRERHGLPPGLTWLKVSYVKKIQNLSDLVHLCFLHIGNLISYDSVVLEGIEKLIKLEQLIISCSNVKSLSIEWCALQQLKSLKLHCPKLEFGKCKLPPSLESLDLVVNEWGRLPVNVSSLKNLIELRLSNFVIEESDLVQGLESLQVLGLMCCILMFDDHFPVLKRLTSLSLYECRSSHMGASPSHMDDDDDDLEEEEEEEFQIKLCNLNNLSVLMVIAVPGTPELQMELCNLKNLSRLEVTGFLIHDDGFKVEGLECLSEVIMNGCTIFESTNNVFLLTTLRSLFLERCCLPTMIDLPPQLIHLVDLSIEDCRGLVDIQGMGNLKSLAQLYVFQCDSLRRIDDISELNGLASIDIHHCTEFQEINGVDKLISDGTLTQLFIYDCKCKDAKYRSSFFSDQL